MTSCRREVFYDFTISVRYPLFIVLDSKALSDNVNKVLYSICIGWPLLCFDTLGNFYLPYHLGLPEALSNGLALGVIPPSHIYIGDPSKGCVSDNVGFLVILSSG